MVTICPNLFTKHPVIEADKRILLSFFYSLTLFSLFCLFFTVNQPPIGELPLLLLFINAVGCFNRLPLNAGHTVDEFCLFD